jgi:predicted ribosome quality control (RQC) complex YloA/Tae2 family protein
MDAFFFRALSTELVALCAGGRIGKIGMPAEGFWSIEHHVPGAWWQYVLLRADVREGLIFPSAAKPDNPGEAPARAMWLRKRVSGRFVTACLDDWRSRRLAWELSPGEGRYLVLDLVHGLSLAGELPPGFGDEPVWPELATALADPVAPGRSPFLSRPIRRVLAGLPLAEAQRLWEPLKAGGAAAWTALTSLPELALAMGLPDGFDFRLGSLDAARAAGQAAYFGALTRLAEAEALGQAKTAAKRAKRLRERLASERARLEGLVSMRQKADAVAASLDRLDPRAKLARLDQGGAGLVELDLSLTVIENMERFYKLAAKGKRGLSHLAAREAALASGSPDAVVKLQAVGRAGKPGSASADRNQGKAVSKAQGKSAGKSGGKPQEIEARRYRTSDGFVALRGKNARANHMLLAKAASPFDYWFHAEGGAGAHVILKRDHPGVDIPRRSLEEAAVLAALAGWERGAAKGRVICALAKDVRHIKGAALGAVAVDKVLESLVVTLDPALETRLRQD